MYGLPTRYKEKNQEENDIYTSLFIRTREDSFHIPGGEWSAAMSKDVARTSIVLKHYSITFSFPKGAGDVAARKVLRHAVPGSVAVFFS